MGQDRVDVKCGGEREEDKSPRGEIRAAHVLCGFGEVRLGVETGELRCRVVLL